MNQNRQDSQGKKTPRKINCEQVISLQALFEGKRLSLNHLVGLFIVSLKANRRFGAGRAGGRGGGSVNWVSGRFLIPFNAIEHLPCERHCAKEFVRDKFFLHKL